MKIQLNIVTSYVRYPEKFTRDDADEPFLQLSILIVTLPVATAAQTQKKIEFVN